MRRVVALCLVLISGGTASADWLTEYNAARKLADAGKHKEAAPALAKAAESARRELNEQDVNLATVRYMLGISLNETGKPKEALVVLKQSLAVREAHLEKDSPITAVTLVPIAKAHAALSQIDEAVAAYEKCLAMRERKLGLDNKTTTATRIVLAGFLRRQGRVEQAATLYRSHLDRQEALHGKDSPELIAAIDFLARVQCDRKRFDEALTLYDRNIAIYERTKGKDSVETAEALLLRANAGRSAKRYGPLDAMFARALAIYEAKAGKDDVEMCGILNDYANFLDDVGRSDEARKLYTRALSICSAKLGKDHPQTAEILHNLGVHYTFAGRHADAESMFNPALAIRRRKLGDSPETALTIESLAESKSLQGDFAKALSLYEEALKMRVAVHGDDHPAVAGVRNQLGDLQKALARFPLAEAQYLKAHAILKKCFGESSIETAKQARKLAYLYYAMGQPAKGKPFVQAAVELLTMLDPQSPEFPGALHDFGHLMLSFNEPVKAEKFLRDSLNRQKKLSGMDKNDIGDTTRLLASALEFQGKRAEAVEVFKQAKAIIVRDEGAGSIRLGRTLLGLATQQAALKQRDDAVATFDELRRIQQKYATRIVAWLPEADQLNFLRHTDQDDFHAALSLALEPGDSIVERSAEWVLNGKALAWQALARQALAARDSRDPAMAAASKELERVRSRLGQFSLTESKEAKPEQRNQAELLEKREKELSEKLAKLGGLAGETPWIDLADVRKAIPAGGALIEIVRFRVAAFQAKPDEEQWKPARYVAWIIPGSGAVELVDLGPAAAIDKAIVEVRKELEASDKRIKEIGEPAAEKKLAEAMQPLSDAVLKPIQARAGNYAKWIVSPDANLWLVPWEAMRTADGKFLLEEHGIRYVVSGRDLLTKKDERKLAAPLMLADPDYNLGLDKAEAETRSLLRNVENQRGRSASRKLALGNITRLPGTAQEAEAVLPRLQQYSKVEPKLWTGAQAVEGIVKAAKSPAVLVLSTHGFFLPDTETDGKTRMDSVASIGDNPLLRCGLLFAGCNDHANAADKLDDGVLTGMEVAGIDLRGTGLVVLSACETGLGDIRNGEGVAGLRQAFHLAGAESVVASLWQVPDRETALLMTRFFDNLSAGKDRAESLGEAQRAIVKQRRDRFNAAHPFYWAAFGLTGREK